MTIVIAAVLVLAIAGLGVAVLSTIAGRAPDKAALLLVLCGAVGGMGAFLLLLAGVLLLGFRDPSVAGSSAPGVAYAWPVRLTTGLALAVVLVVLALVLIRTGDWARPDDDVLDR